MPRDVSTLPIDRDFKRDHTRPPRTIDYAVAHNARDQARRDGADEMALQ
jgi:hypothetical protein